MGRTKERAWRGKDELKSKLSYINKRKRKIKQAHKLLDDEDDVAILDPKRKRCELVQNVSSMLDSSLDDDDGGSDDDDDVELLDSKQKQCELVDDDDGGGDDDDDDDNDDDIDLLVPKHKQHEFVDGGGGGDGDGDGDNDGDDDNDDDIKLLDPKQKQCELVDDDDDGDDDDGGGGGGDDDDGDDDDGGGGGGDDDDGDDDDGGGGGGDDEGDGGGDVELVDPKQEQCELVDDDDVAVVDDDGGGDVELLDPKQEQHELVDNMSPMSVSPEKHSSFQSGIVYVRGYKVKQSIATILESIFKKHGDIAANCVFKASSTRTHFLEAVCEIIERIQTNDMIELVKDNIESKLSDAEAANINVSWIRAHFEAVHKRNESDKKYSLLMEMKSNTMLVKAAAQMDLRERCQELMDAQERFEKAEKCVRVLHLVEKNLNDNILESKAEIDSLEAHPVV